MLPDLVCDRCGNPPKHFKPKGIKSFTCGMCNVIGMIRNDKRGEAVRSQVDISLIKKKRKAQTPKLTQRTLAFHLKIHWLKVSEAERGVSVPCQEIIDWLNLEEEDGTATTDKQDPKPRGRKKKRRRKRK